MQKLAEVCVARPVFAVMLILCLVVVGAVSYSKLGIDRFPDVDMPLISVRTNLPGASPEEMESTVTRFIEDSVATVEGIDNIRSTSTESLSVVTVTFDLSRDIDVAAQDIRDAVAGTIVNLPRDAKPPLIKKLDTDASPVMTLVLTGEKTPRELYELADRNVKDSIESVGGVGQVVVVGGQRRAVNVWVDADRLAAYKIPILQVRDAIERQNSDIPGGRVDEGHRELVLRTLGRFPDPRLFNELVVATINGAPVRIRDIGYAEDGHKEQRTWPASTAANRSPSKSAASPAPTPWRWSTTSRPASNASSNSSLQASNWKPFKTSPATSAPLSTRSSSTSSSAPSSPRSSSSSSCATGAPPSSAPSPSRPPSSPPSA